MLAVGGALAALIYLTRTLARREPLPISEPTTNRRLWSSLAAAFGLLWLSAAGGGGAAGTESPAAAETVGFLAAFVSVIWWGTLVRDERRTRQSPRGTLGAEGD